MVWSGPAGGGEKGKQLLRSGSSNLGGSSSSRAGRRGWPPFWMNINHVAGRVGAADFAYATSNMVTLRPWRLELILWVSDK